MRLPIPKLLLEDMFVCLVFSLLPILTNDIIGWEGEGFILRSYIAIHYRYTILTYRTHTYDGALYMDI